MTRTRNVTVLRVTTNYLCRFIYIIISDIIGIADVLFPAIFAGWAYRFDQETNRLGDNNKQTVYRNCLFGFVTGCVLLEVFQTGEGQPALLYIIPSMVISLLLGGIQNKNLNNMWNRNNED